MKPLMYRQGPSWQPTRRSCWRQDASKGRQEYDLLLSWLWRRAGDSVGQNQPMTGRSGPYTRQPRGQERGCLIHFSPARALPTLRRWVAERIGKNAGGLKNNMNPGPSRQWSGKGVRAVQKKPGTGPSATERNSRPLKSEQC